MTSLFSSVGRIRSQSNKKKFGTGIEEALVILTILLTIFAVSLFDSRFQPCDKLVGGYGDIRRICQHAQFYFAKHDCLSCGSLLSKSQ